MNQKHIITADKEKEFSLHEEITSKFNEFICVAKLYHSWKKEPTKNTNG
jgi:IS30 family transposase